ncbi:hypothetical protein KBC79_03105 [Candidatus Woesebacteria bacterium]|nr:hypothetical protein [Candidatus Woesebacteria bacterium]
MLQAVVRFNIRKIIAEAIIVCLLANQTVVPIGVWATTDFPQQQSYDELPLASDIEILEKRTEFSKTFLVQTETGTHYRLEQTSHPQHYLDEREQWQDINLSLRPVADGSWVNITNSFSTYFAAHTLSPALTRVSYDGSWFELSVPATQPTIGQLTSLQDGQQALQYKDLYKGLDVRFSLQPNRLVKEFLFASSAEVQVELPFVLKVSEGVTAQLERGQVVLRKNNTVIGVIPQPRLYEAENRQRGFMLEGGVEFALQSLGNSTYALKKVLKDDALIWLRQPNRQYPVAVDGTLNLQVGSSSDDGDAHESGLDPSITRDRIPIGSYNGNEHLGAARFTSVALSQAETITSADFILTALGTYDCGSCTLSTTLQMDDVDDSAALTTSNMHNRTLTTASTNADIKVTVESTEYSFDVTSQVQEVVDRAGWATGNDMTVIALDNGSTGSEWQEYYSYDNTTSKAPKLTIEYGAAVSYEQEGFRWRADDGSESAATWLASQDTNISRAVSTTTRLRTLVNATSDPDSNQYQLEYKKSSDSTYRIVRTADTFASIATSNTTNGTSLAGGVSLNMPSGINVGDLLIIFASNDSTGGTNMGVSGWTSLFSDQYTGDVISHAAWAKIAVGSDTATLTGASQDYAALVLRVTGHGVTTIASDIKVGTPAETAGANPDPPSLDAGSSKKWLWLESFGSDDDDNTATYWSTSFTGAGQVESAQSTSSTMNSVAYYQSETQTLDPGTMAMALSEEAVANTIAIPPFAEQIVLSASSNITASGENTTVQLTAPSGKSTSDFVAGRIQDDENPADAVNITTDDYTELEWSIAATTVATNGDVYTFRVTVAGTAFDTYTVTPQMTISAGDSTYTQSSYRWYADSDNENVTAVWGNPDIAEDTALTLLPATNATPVSGDEIRLRVAITIGTSNLSASSQQFKLQYKAGTDESCTTGSWTDVGASGGGVIWRYATSSVTDGTTLTVLKLTVADVLGVYSKASPTATNPNGANIGQDIEYDFHIQQNAAGNATVYSFRVVESDGTELTTYSECPTLSTRQIVDQELRHGNVFGDEIERGMTRVD